MTKIVDFVVIFDEGVKNVITMKLKRQRLHISLYN